MGGAVFVDRVLYGGPDVQRVALGALAAATAVGALGSGLALRVVGLRLVTVVGLVLSTAALVRMSAWTPATELPEVAWLMGAFGLGFGLTVTPRSTAAVDALGQAAFGVASATVTVARMIGMAIGLAALTAFGSTTIDRLYAQVYATADSYKLFVPPALRDRPLKDGLVVQALEVVGLERGGPDPRRHLPRRRARHGHRPDPGAGPRAAAYPRAGAGSGRVAGRHRGGRGQVTDEAGGSGVDASHHGRGLRRRCRPRVGRTAPPSRRSRAGSSGPASAGDPARPGSTSSAPDAALVGRVARLLGLHELIAEDIVEGNQRSKIEATDGLVHIVLFALDFGDVDPDARDRHRPRRGLPPDRPTRRTGIHGPGPTSGPASGRS